MTQNIDALAQRYLAVKEIEKIMGMHTFLHLQLKNRAELEQHWSCREDISLTTNHGTYAGREAVWAWYVEEFEQRSLAGDLAMQVKHQPLQGYPAEEFHGVGTFLVDTFTTPIVEVAGDMETAKGWFCGSAITTEIVEGEPSGRWTWRKYGVDFIREDGAWKVWHLRAITDFSILPGASWVDGNDELPFGSLPNDLSFQYPLYSTERALTLEPQLPEPYEHFCETFSY